MTNYSVPDGKWGLCYNPETKIIMCKFYANGDMHIATEYIVAIFDTEQQMQDFIVENNLIELNPF